MWATIVYLYRVRKNSMPTFREVILGTKTKIYCNGNVMSEMRLYSATDRQIGPVQF